MTNNSSPNIDPTRIEELQKRWDEALVDVKSTLYPGEVGEPAEILAKLSQKNFQHQNDKMVIGVAGPGASGKGTLSKFILGDLGFSKAVNITTREAREGEVDGKDYYFTNESDFNNI